MICQNDYHIVFLILLLSYITSLFGSELTLFGSELIFAHRFNKLFFFKVSSNKIWNVFNQK